MSEKIRIDLSEPSARLEWLIANAAEMTPEQRFEQRVSFVYGQMGASPLTKDEIRERLIEQGAGPKPGVAEKFSELEAIKARLADSEKLEWLVYEIFYANPIAFARKNLVIALQRHLLGEPLATPEEEQLRHLDTLSEEDRAAWHRANNAEKLKRRGVS